MPAKVLDSRALLAFFMDEEPAASRVEKIIKDAVRTDRNKVYLSAVGWSELYAGLERAAGQDMARETMARLRRPSVLPWRRRGGNIDAARYSGINVRFVKWAAFAICGVGAALGGLMQSAYNATANTTAPEPWMLKSIAAVFLGMALMRNGRPNLPGTILGVILFRTLENGLNKTDINNYVQDVINWGAVIVAVLPPAIARIRENR